MIDANDVSLLVQAIQFGIDGGGPLDVNRDGVVDVRDLEIVLDQFGQEPPQPVGDIAQPCEYRFLGPSGEETWWCPEGTEPVLGPFIEQ